MRIQIINPYWTSMGGGEKYALSLARALAWDNKVSVVVPPNVDLKRFESLTGLNLDGVWITPEATDKHDLSIYVCNWKPVRPKGKYIHILQIPYGKIIPRLYNPKEGFKDIQRLRLLKQARENGNAIVYSKFVQETLWKYHKVKSTVLYPPIEDMYEEGIPKKNIILSVGRITDCPYNNKRYDVLIDAWEKIRSELPGWEYHIVGSCDNDEYALELKSIHPSVCFHINESHGVLGRLYNEAKIFWHGAGYDATRPENFEHFGMTTVEAMSAGCVPIVAEGGGQTEIMADGYYGFTYNCADGLARGTIKLLQHPAFIAEESQSVRRRAKDFSVERFNVEALRLIGQL